MAASFHGHIELVKLLLKKHAILEARDEKGNTSIKLATQQGHQAVVKLLMLAHLFDCRSSYIMRKISEMDKLTRQLERTHVSSCTGSDGSVHKRRRKDRNHQGARASRTLRGTIFCECNIKD